MAAGTKTETLSNVRVLLAMMKMANESAYVTTAGDGDCTIGIYGVPTPCPTTNSTQVSGSLGFAAAVAGYFDEISLSNILWMAACMAAML
jgi:hypothetical protein